MIKTPSFHCHRQVAHVEPCGRAMISGSREKLGRFGWWWLGVMMSGPVVKGPTSLFENILAWPANSCVKVKHVLLYYILPTCFTKHVSISPPIHWLKRTDSNMWLSYRTCQAARCGVADGSRELNSGFPKRKRSQHTSMHIMHLGSGGGDETTRLANFSEEMRQITSLRVIPTICQKTCQTRMSEDMPERMPQRMPEIMAEKDVRRYVVRYVRKNVKKNVRIGCQKRCQKICQKRIS